MQGDRNNLQHPGDGAPEHGGLQDESGAVEEGGVILRQRERARKSHNVQQLRLPLQKNEQVEKRTAVLGEGTGD